MSKMSVSTLERLSCFRHAAVGKNSLRCEIPWHVHFDVHFSWAAVIESVTRAFIFSVIVLLWDSSPSICARKFPTKVAALTLNSADYKNGFLGLGFLLAAESFKSFAITFVRCHVLTFLLFFWGGEADSRPTERTGKSRSSACFVSVLFQKNGNACCLELGLPGFSGEGQKSSFSVWRLIFTWIYMKLPRQRWLGTGNEFVVRTDSLRRTDRKTDR